jgi:7,8-dihydropterin-6-yl-methyl-4-(beta-D-ribofuranosyl)aminobenzene 5'-phosphate synthase
MALKLKVYVLVDNTASSNCNAEHGLSYLIDFDRKVLFDTGQSDLFLKNAKILEAPLHEIDTVVLSHGHYDHGNGLRYINNMTLICHPDIFLERYSGKLRKPVGLHLTQTDLRIRFNVKSFTEPHWLSDKMVYLGQIPRKFGFEKNETNFYLENGEPDLLYDDSALAIKLNQGLFIISGCAHSGICNTIEHAKKVMNENQVFGAIGGFHLKFNNKQTQETLEYFKQNNIKVVMPSHCTELPALAVFHNEFGGEQVKSGTLYTFDEE